MYRAENHATISGAEKTCRAGHGGRGVAATKSMRNRAKISFFGPFFRASVRQAVFRTGRFTYPGFVENLMEGSVGSSAPLSKQYPPPALRQTGKQASQRADRLTDDIAILR